MAKKSSGQLNGFLIAMLINPNQPDEVIWVTGASSGLGRSLCLLLASQGYRVVASARNAQALDELAALSERITPLAFDITDDSNIEAIASQLQAITPYLDRVILNAGNCEYLDFPNPDWSAIASVMAVNYLGSVNCLRIALPLLRLCPEGRAHVIGIASLASSAAFPRAEAYGASKAALQYFLSSLRLDLAAENIDVTVVNPGFIDTPLTQRNYFAMPFLISAEHAAEIILQRAFSRPRSSSFPRRLALLLRISKIFPGLWQKLVSRR